MKNLIIFLFLALHMIQASCQTIRTQRNRSDHDWYSETTGRQPRSIEDSIFTYGDVGINTPTPNDALDVKGSLQVHDSVRGVINADVDLHIDDSNENLFIQATGFAPSRSLRIVSPGSYDIDVYNDDNGGTYLYKAGATYSAGLFGSSPAVLQEVQRTGAESSILSISDTIDLGNDGASFTGFKILPNSIDQLKVFGGAILLDDFPNSRADEQTPVNFLATDANGWIQSISIDSISSGGGGASALNDLSDVNTAGLTTNDVLTYSGAGWGPVALPDASASNEIQSLSISGNDLSISNGNTVTIPTTSYNAGSGIAIDGSNNIIAFDNSPNNEIQSLSLSGSDLTISGGNTVSLPTGGGLQSAVMDMPTKAITNATLTTLDISPDYSTITGSLVNTTSDYFTVPAGTYQVTASINVAGGLNGTNQFVRIEAAGNTIGNPQEYRIQYTFGAIPTGVSFSTIVRNTSASMNISCQYYDDSSAANSTSGKLIITKLD